MIIYQNNWRTLYPDYKEGSDPVEFSLGYVNRQIEKSPKIDNIAEECLKDLYQIGCIEKNRNLSTVTNILQKVIQLKPASWSDLDVATKFSKFGFEYNWKFSGIFYFQLISKSEKFRNQLQSEYNSIVLNNVKYTLEQLSEDLKPCLRSYRSVQLCHFIIMKILWEKKPDLSDEEIYQLLIKRTYNSLKNKYPDIYKNLCRRIFFNETLQGPDIKDPQISLLDHNIVVTRELMHSYLEHCLENNRYFQCSFVIDPDHTMVIDKIWKSNINNTFVLLYQLRVYIQKIFVLTSSSDLLCERLGYIRQLILRIDKMKSPKVSDLKKRKCKRSLIYVPGDRSAGEAGLSENVDRRMLIRKLRVHEVTEIMAGWHANCIEKFVSRNIDRLADSLYQVLHQEILETKKIKQRKNLMDNLIALFNESIRVKNFEIAMCLNQLLQKKELSKAFNSIIDTKEKYQKQLRNSKIPPVPVMGFIKNEFMAAKKRGDIKRCDAIKNEFKKRQEALKAAYPI